MSLASTLAAAEPEAAAPPRVAAASALGSSEDAGPPNIGIGPLQVGVWSRADVGLGVGNELDDPFSTGLFQVALRGRVQKYFSVITSLAAAYDERDQTSTVALLDGIIAFEAAEAFNVWVGRMLLPQDRSNLSGPWFMAPWYFTGLGHADGQVPLPRAGAYGRSDGVTAWGQFGGGVLKYYAGAFDLQTTAEAPLLAGRVSLDLLSPEPGYYGNSTFYGKDILGIGAGVQAKRRGSVNPVTQATDDYTEYNADLLFEKDLGAAGVLDLEGAYYKFNGTNERTASSWLGLVSYVLPGDIAGARLQPLVRVQQALPAADGAPTSTLVDAQVALILKAHFSRVVVGYRTGSAGDLRVRSIFLGLQLMRM